MTNWTQLDQFGTRKKKKKTTLNGRANDQKKTKGLNNDTTTNCVRIIQDSCTFSNNFYTEQSLSHTQEFNWEKRYHHFARKKLRKFNGYGKKFFFLFIRNFVERL